MVDGKYGGHASGASVSSRKRVSFSGTIFNVCFWSAHLSLRLTFAPAACPEGIFIRTKGRHGHGGGMVTDCALSSARSFMRLLIVEDEPDLRRALEKGLQEEGYAVDAAEDGDEGLFKAETWDYDVILLDVMLPVMDGWQVLERLRRTKKTPVLMLTARDSVKDRVHGLDLGSDDYLAKPFSFAELMARIRALIRRSSGEGTSLIDLGTVKVDTARRTVLQGGEPVELTAREYALVEMLAFRRGKVVTRTTLYDHLFAEEDQTMSNLLDVHVCNVRKKLGKDFIETRRGHGYMIEG
jgi:two-component system, OmpR family, response regulator